MPDMKSFRLVTAFVLLFCLFAGSGCGLSVSLREMSLPEEAVTRKIVSNATAHVKTVDGKTRVLTVSVPDDGYCVVAFDLPANAAPGGRHPIDRAYYLSYSDEACVFYEFSKGWLDFTESTETQATYEISFDFVTSTRIRGKTVETPCRVTGSMTVSRLGRDLDYIRDALRRFHHRIESDTNHRYITTEHAKRLRTLTPRMR
jgi:hypothetical protein